MGKDTQENHRCTPAEKNFRGLVESVPDAILIATNGKRSF